MDRALDRHLLAAARGGERLDRVEADRERSCVPVLIATGYAVDAEAQAMPAVQSV